MTDYATPNLPSRDFEATSQFYQRLGFKQGWRDDWWMILTRGGLMLEFFRHRDLDPAESCFSCCLRVGDLPAFYQVCKDAGVPEQYSGWPRLRPPAMEDSGLTIAYMVDPDGTLVRLIQD